MLSGKKILNESNPRSYVVRATRSLVFCVMLCRSHFVILSLFVWQLYCLSFIDLRLQITPLVPSTLVAITNEQSRDICNTWNIRHKEKAKDHKNIS